MIDMILGGPGQALTANRNLTEIELNIIEGVIRLAMRDLRGAWHPIIELDFFLEGKGTKSQMFQLVSPAEAVIAVHLELKIGENSGLMNLCIPSRLLKQLRGKFDQQWNVRRQKTSGNEAEKIIAMMKTVPVELAAEMRQSKLTVDDLLKVSVGDVIQLNERVGDPVYMCVAGIPKYLGRIVVQRGNKAIEISDKYIG
jgi:flagellar motor switch protein FliM